MRAKRSSTSEDLRGLVRLTTEAVTGVTDVVEAMHGTIQRVPFPLGAKPRKRTRGITGLVYGSVRLGTRLVGGAIGTALEVGASAIPELADDGARRRAVAILNGVYGDHLEATGNPLALPMALRWRGRALDPVEPARVLGNAAGRDLLVLVHGLCLSDLSWRSEATDRAAQVANVLGFTPLHVSYNTGLPIARSGRALAELLALVTAAWPVPVGRIALIGHSMGGLVVRSACHHGVAAGMAWAEHVDRLAFLGTPHGGAPLEKAGYLVERLIGISPYSAPLALIAKARSAGITDLRMGRIADEDDGVPRLPAQARCLALGAVLGPSRRRWADAVLGDGLVPLASALGQHPEAAFTLPAADRHVVHEVGHLGLLADDRVFAHVARWMGDRTGPA